MRLLRFSLLLSGSLASTLATAQPVPIQATVRNANTKQPLAYATVYSAQMHTGTYSDENGHVALKLDASDTITVSFLSFEIRRIPVSKLVGVGEILLNEAAVTLDTIAVKSTKKRRKTYRIGFYDDDTDFDAWGLGIGYIATNYILNNTEKTGYLNSLLVDLGKASNQVHRAKARVRIYGADNPRQGPGRDMLNENIVFDIPRFATHQKIDLTPFHIKFPLEGLFIGIEFLGFETKEGFNQDWKQQTGGRITSTKREDYRSVGYSWLYTIRSRGYRWVCISDASTERGWKKILFKIGADVSTDE
ncbi:carboxypeptidase-like regulatory domain-containing protein [uncultured Fibrella sp.]|uniref:carboxypeptidase-like regulatory domain-containing protein n=1 Tax=uncultured Fibrella sp. TaxID=1284596 RepID=UPI0035C9E467